MKRVFKKMVVELLTLEARITLMRHKPTVVAITGSVGKTGTKDAVYAGIAQMRFARKSQKSFNSELGVPLTILGLPTAWSSPYAWLENIFEGVVVALFSRSYPEWLVLEVGADRPGDIRRLHWLRPHVVVLTSFPDVPAHVEFFDSPEQVIAEKRELKKALRSEGTLIINADDPKMHDEQIAEGQHLLRFGFSPDADVRAVEAGILYEGGVPVGMFAKILVQGVEYPVVLHDVLGTHHILPVLASCAVALAEGLSPKEVLTALTSHHAPPGRMRIIPGAHATTLIDDTYNASPTAVEAGLQTLGMVTCGGKKVAVLGDMLELGEYSHDAHVRIGERVVEQVALFVGVGVRMQRAVESAQVKNPAVRCIYAKDAQEAVRVLEHELQQGDVVYVKGSQGMRMERVVASLMADPARASELLVRQEEAWKKKA